MPGRVPIRYIVSPVRGHVGARLSGNRSRSHGCKIALEPHASATPVVRQIEGNKMATRIPKNHIIGSVRGRESLRVTCGLGNSRNAADVASQPSRPAKTVLWKIQRLDVPVQIAIHDIIGPVSRYEPVRFPRRWWSTGRARNVAAEPLWTIHRQIQGLNMTTGVAIENIIGAILGQESR